MNVARSTFVQRGYLLTALAVAVLLFASSGTAWAQTKVTASSRFSGSSGTLPEGADLADLSEPRPLKVTITRSARSKNDPYNNPPSGTDAHLILQFEHNGARGLPAGITVKADDSTNALPISATGTADLTFASSGKTRSESTTVRITTTDPPTEHPDKVVDNIEVANTQIVLTIEDDRMDDGDWLPETFSMTVSKHSALGRATEFTDDGTAADSTTTTQQRLAATRDPYVNDFTSSKFTVTIADDDPKPKFRFSSRDIQLAKENVQKVTASVGVGPGGASPLPVAEGGTCGGLRIVSVAGLGTPLRPVVATSCLPSDPRMPLERSLILGMVTAMSSIPTPWAGMKSARSRRLRPPLASCLRSRRKQYPGSGMNKLRSCSWTEGLRRRWRLKGAALTMRILPRSLS